MKTLLMKPLLPSIFGRLILGAALCFSNAGYSQTLKMAWSPEIEWDGGVEVERYEPFFADKDYLYVIYETKKTPKNGILIEKRGVIRYNLATMKGDSMGEFPQVKINNEDVRCFPLDFTGQPLAYANVVTPDENSYYIVPMEYSKEGIKAGEPIRIFTRTSSPSMFSQLGKPYVYSPDHSKMMFSSSAVTDEGENRFSYSILSDHYRNKPLTGNIIIEEACDPVLDYKGNIHFLFRGQSPVWKLHSYSPDGKLIRKTNLKTGEDKSAYVMKLSFDEQGNVFVTGLFCRPGELDERTYHNDGWLFFGMSIPVPERKVRGAVLFRFGEKDSAYTYAERVFSIEDREKMFGKGKADKKEMIDDKFRVLHAGICGSTGVYIFEIESNKYKSTAPFSTGMMDSRNEYVMEEHYSSDLLIFTFNTSDVSSLTFRRIPKEQKGLSSDEKYISSFVFPSDNALNIIFADHEGNIPLTEFDQNIKTAKAPFNMYSIVTIDGGGNFKRVALKDELAKKLVTEFYSHSNNILIGFSETKFLRKYRIGVLKLD